jgi:hypothetical protein
MLGGILRSCDPYVWKSCGIMENSTAPWCEYLEIIPKGRESKPLFATEIDG